MRHYDALVVGGGPAGATTALRLARSGLAVLLADKATFPRDKPCGGGLTLRAVRNCPVDPSPVVEDEVGQFELRFRYSASVSRRMKAPVVWMTQRSRLDAFLLDAARQSGVEVQEGVRVSLGERMSVGGDRVRADVIVGADGANGVTARAVGLGGGIHYGVAYEGNVGAEAIDLEPFRGRAFIELGSVPGGYGWVFPKRDHVNVGVGAWASDASRLKAQLRAVCGAHGIPFDSLTRVRGHRLPLKGAQTTLAGDRALLVGDAAGLLDPVSGDGIYECFVSSRLAAQAIVEFVAGREPTLLPYEHAVERELGRFYKTAWSIKRALDRWPRASWQVARTKLVWRTLDGLLQGDLADPREQAGVAAIPIRLLGLMGR